MQSNDGMRTLPLIAALMGCQSAPPASPVVRDVVAAPSPQLQPASDAGSGSRPAPPNTPKPPAPPTPPGTQFEHDMMVRYHMHGNVDLARAIERLLIRGKLEEARGLARAIAEAPLDPELGSWVTQASLVRERAAALAAAPSVDEACRRDARLAEACAMCHIDTRVQPEFRNPPPLPPDADAVAARMARHRWAADRLWEGLVGADDSTWRAGLAVLAAAPLRWPELGERKGFARQLQQLAEQARQRAGADQLADRTTAYGELLVTCAACHRTPAP